MEFKTQTNQQPQQPVTSAVRPTVNSSPNSPGSSGRRKLFALVVTAIVVLGLLVGAFALWQWKSDDTTATGVEANKYQAVFMTNGQVYFGHLANVDDTYTELTDVYYLQVQQPVQPATEAKTADASQSQVSLTKLGNELHGPTDKMHISRDQVLFWENLKDDSTVVKAITEYKAKQ